MKFSMLCEYIWNLSAEQKYLIVCESDKKAEYAGVFEAWEYFIVPSTFLMKEG